MKVLVRWSIQGETLVDTKSLEAAKDRVTEIVNEMPDCGLHSHDQISEVRDDPEILSAVIVDWADS